MQFNIALISLALSVFAGFSFAADAPEENEVGKCKTVAGQHKECHFDSMGSGLPCKFGSCGHDGSKCEYKLQWISRYIKDKKGVQRWTVTC